MPTQSARSPLRATARLPLIAAAAAATTLIATGCGAGTTDTGPGSANGDWTPVTIEHAFGSTEIDRAPERIVTVGWSDEATLLELGIVPVGMAASTYGDEDGYLPWDLEKIDELGADKPELFGADDGIPAEQVANLAPDLILGVQSGMQESEYKQLSEIAPTVPYLGEPWMTDWQEQTLAIGEAVGRKDDAQRIVDSTTEYIAGLAADHPEFEGTTFAMGMPMLDSGSLAFVTEGDQRYEVMKQLGFTPADFHDSALSVEDGRFYGLLSLEDADQVDADVLVMWFGTEKERGDLDGNDVFSKIGAVADGGYAPFDDDRLSMAFSTPNPLTLPWAMDDVVPMLSAAAKGEA
ncbi:iron complex transport system substrate-binding protein [Nocardiopsis mwathae]|uniref:Iron complex transport system substrate-binding protein n=1 Tax=Nocardiopsis mwathae TaxID=1472723 RepID=A0A7W9YJJ6_9ACTN|nr:iron-siderophore ABC transporter substrate-binding protein [Nocardiopsis mwathae]MBB6173348.1 iron complex transport system substrate-binding protein [Nocardiopsis mwathae]